MEQRRPDDRPPQGAPAAQKAHHHHEETEGHRREGHLEGLDEADHVAEQGPRDAEKERRDGPADGLVTHGVDAHSLGLLLVVPDGVGSQPEPAQIDPSEEEKEDHRQHETQGVEEQRAIVRFAGIDGQRDAAAAADVVPGACQLAGRQGDAQGADGEVGAAQPEDDPAQNNRENHRPQPRRDQPHRQAGEILLRRELNLHRAVGGGVLGDVVVKPDLDHGADVHADAEESDVTQRVVAHLPAQDVPGEGEQDHHPKHGELERIIRKQERRRDAGDE